MLTTFGSMDYCEPSNEHRVLPSGCAGFSRSTTALVTANFAYPDILDGSAAEVLPRLRSGGSVMRAVWALYALLPLLLVPGAVGTY
ncbi:MAG: hypothetical protein ACXW6T_13695, partial [Candidatus Binatia bacterium]